MKVQVEVLKKSACVLALLLISASCVNLEGQLDIKQTLSAKKKSGFLNLKTKEIKIEPDLYNAELKINSEKSFTLKLIGRENILIPIKSDKSLNIPSNGQVKISHEDIGQPFDLSGTISTEVSNTEIVHAIESCTFYVTENHCKKICENEHSCKIECKDEQVAFLGKHEVDYHFQTINRELSMDLLKQSKNEVLASFHGTDSETSRITDHESQCQIMR